MYEVEHQAFKTYQSIDGEEWSSKASEAISHGNKKERTQPWSLDDCS
jgi:hypothetical protein